jgi:hypothetical protein
VWRIARGVVSRWAAAFTFALAAHTRQTLIGLVCLDSTLDQSRAALPAIVADADLDGLRLSQQQTTSPSRRPVQSTSALNGFASISLVPLTPGATHLTLRNHRRSVSWW